MSHDQKDVLWFISCFNIKPLLRNAQRLGCFKDEGRVAVPLGWQQAENS